MTFPGNIEYFFTYTLNGESCIDNPNGNSCEFTHRLLVDSSIDGENWTLFGEFNQNSGAFTITGQEGSNRSGNLPGFPDNNNNGIYIRFRLKEITTQFVVGEGLVTTENIYEDFDFPWTAVSLDNTNCTEEDCSIHTSFEDAGHPFIFDFTDPPPIIEGCTDPTAENYNPAAEQDNGTCILISDYAGEIVISEIHPKNNISSTAFSYVKVYNNSDTTIDMTGWYFKGWDYVGFVNKFFGLSYINYDTDNPANTVRTADWYIPGYRTQEHTGGNLNPNLDLDDNGLSDSGIFSDVAGHTSRYLPAPSPLIKPGGFMMFERHGQTSANNNNVNRFTNYDSSFHFRGEINCHEVLDLRDNEGKRVDFVEYNLSEGGSIFTKAYWDGLLPEPDYDVSWSSKFESLSGTKTIELTNPNSDNNSAENWEVTLVADNGICDRNTNFNSESSYNDDVLYSCFDGGTQLGPFGGTPNLPNSRWNGIVEGCTIKSADNYNSEANVDSGICEFQGLDDIIINEIHYNPSETYGQGDEYEFIELYNRSESDKNLYGVGITLNNTTPRTYVFGDVDIPAQSFVVLAKDAAKYDNDNVNGLEWGINLFEWKEGVLNNTGLPFKVEIKKPNQVMFNDEGYGVVNYGNQDTEPEWPRLRRGGSLELVDSTLIVGLYDSTNWRNSSITGGTPNLRNTGGVDVLISEIQGIVPSESAGWGNQYFEFIELYNPTAEDIDLTGWYLRGFDYDFPERAMIKAESFIVVARNPGVYAGNSFNGSYADDDDHRIQIDHLVQAQVEDGGVINNDEANLFGPTDSGENISDSGNDRLRLFKPGATSNFVVDEVQFTDETYSDIDNGTTLETIYCDDNNDPIDSCSGVGDIVQTMISHTGELFNLPFDLSSNEDGASNANNRKFSFELIFPEGYRDNRGAWADYNNYDATNWAFSYQYGGSPGFERLEPPGEQCTDTSNNVIEGGACNAWVWDDNESLAPESWSLDNINYWPVTQNNDLCYYPTTYCDCADATAAIANNNDYSDDNLCGCCNGVDIGAGQCVGCTDSDADNTNQQSNGNNCTDCDGDSADCTVDDGDTCVYSPVNVNSITLTNQGFVAAGSNTANIKIDFVYNQDNKYPVEKFGILRSNDGGSSFLTITEVDYEAGVTDYTYTDEGVPDNALYLYKIETVGDDGGDSTISDGLISFPIQLPNYGCMVTYASNYEENNTIDDGSCVLNTCTDTNANNYNDNCGLVPDGYATEICEDDGSCTYDPVELINLTLTGPDTTQENSTNNLFQLNCGNGDGGLGNCVQGATLSNTTWNVTSLGLSYESFSHPDADISQLQFTAPDIGDSSDYANQELDYVYTQIFTITANFDVVKYVDGSTTTLTISKDLIVSDSGEFGCTDPTSCNYNTSATYPCNQEGNFLGDNECCANYNDYGSICPDEYVCPNGGQCTGCDSCGVCGGETFFGNEVGDVCGCDDEVVDICGVCDGTGLAGPLGDGVGGIYDSPTDYPQINSGESCPDGWEVGDICNCSGHTCDVCGICNGPGYVVCQEVVENGCPTDGICNPDNCIIQPESDCDCDGNVLDCAGACGGDAYVDQCGECNGSYTNYTGTFTNDVPNGDGTFDNGACDCNGNTIDDCGVCGGLNNGKDDCGNCLGYNGIEAQFYEGDPLVPYCGEGYDGTEEGNCCDCVGVPNGESLVDQCGDCGGLCNTYCDCAGICNGNSGYGCTAGTGEEICNDPPYVEDECNVCNGPGEDACGNCPQDDPQIENLGCGCGAPAPVFCSDNTNPYPPCGPIDEENGSELQTCNPATDCYAPSGCDNACGSILVEDICGVCDGNGPTFPCCTIDGEQIYTCLENNDPENNYSACYGEGGLDIDPQNGICDSSQIFGCTDSNACNYNSQATDDDGSCTYPEQYYNCAGEYCVGEGEELDCAGICNGTSIYDTCGEFESGCYNPENNESPPNNCFGCMDETACNYDVTATIDDGTYCQYPENLCESFDNTIPTDDYVNISCPDDNGICYCNGENDCAGVCGGSSVIDACGVCYDTETEEVPNDCTDSGILSGLCECSGCTDTNACNEDETAQYNDGSCTYPTSNQFNEYIGNTTEGDGVLFDCDGVCQYALDCAGVCNGNSAIDLCGTCNGTCNPTGEGNGNGTDGCVSCADNPDGINICGGDTLCNYDSCEPQDDCGVCFGGSTDCNEENPVNCGCLGCTDESACNYSAAAQYDDGSCYYSGESNTGVDGAPNLTYCNCDSIPQGQDENGNDYCDCIGNIADCAGICGGDTAIDCSGECGGSAVEDCNGDCGGSFSVNNCGVCVEGGLNPGLPCPSADGVEGCEPLPFLEDGVTLACDCIGNDPVSYCVGEDTPPDGRTACNCDCHYIDDCGDCHDPSSDPYEGSFFVTGEDGLSYLDTDGDGSPNTSCDCDGIVIVDSGFCDCEFNVPDCDNVCGGSLSIDECGVCGGDNSTCDEGCGPNQPAPDCAGVCGGFSEVSVCGQCEPNEDSENFYNNASEEISYPTNGITINVNYCDDIYGTCPEGYIPQPGCNGLCYIGDEGYPQQVEGLRPPFVVYDECGVCGGLCNYSGNIPELEFYSGNPCDGQFGRPDCPTADCAGIPQGADGYGHVLDCAETCLYPTDEDFLEIDACGVCNGTTTDPTLCGCDGIHLCQITPNGPICAPTIEQLQEGEIHSYQFYSLDFLTQTGGNLVLCFRNIEVNGEIIASETFGEVVPQLDEEGYQTGIAICTNPENPDLGGTWVTEQNFEWYTNVNYGEEYPDNLTNENEMVNDQGVCCSAGKYPDCMGECKSIDDETFVVPDACGNCPPRLLIEGTPYCLGIENPTAEQQLEAQNDSYNCCDCAGNTFGTLEFDECGICGGPGAIYGPDYDPNTGSGGVCEETVTDCAGVVNGDAVVDICNLCTCHKDSSPVSYAQIYTAEGSDCFPIHPGSTMDGCGVCHDPNNIFIFPSTAEGDLALQTDYQDNGNWYESANPLDINSLAGEGDWNCGDLNDDCPNVDQCGVCFGDSTDCVPQGILTIIPLTSEFGLSDNFVNIKPEGAFDVEDDQNYGGWSVIGDNVTLSTYELEIRDESNILLEGYPKEFARDELMGNFVTFGHIHVFFTEGIYEVTLRAIDSQGYVGESIQSVNISNIVNIEQSVYNTYMPYQGHNLSEEALEEGYENSKSWFETNDKDKRPTLGTFYYNEDNSGLVWSTIGSKYTLANKGTTGNSPRFEKSYTVESVDDARNLGLLSSRQLITHTDRMFYDLLESSNNPTWSTNDRSNVNMLPTNGLTTDLVSNIPSYPITIGPVEQGTIPSDYDDFNNIWTDTTWPKMFVAFDYSTTTNGRFTTRGYDFENGTPEQLENWENEFVFTNIASANDVYIWSMYLQVLTSHADDEENNRITSFTALQGTITKWDGSTGIFYSEQIQLDESENFLKSQLFSLDYRYEGKASVRLNITTEDIVEGCTDPMACNIDIPGGYNPLANYNDGSCVYAIDNETCVNPGEAGDLTAQGEMHSLDVPGCTDPTVDNYNPLATYNDGSCPTEPELNETQGKWKTSSGYKGYFTITEKGIDLEYFSGTKLEAEISNIFKNQLRVQFIENESEQGSILKHNMIWDRDTGDLLWSDDNGDSSFVTVDPMSGKKWYRVWMFAQTNVLDENNDGKSSIQVQFWPASNGESGTAVFQGAMYVFGPQLEKINIGQLSPTAYIRNADPDYSIEADYPKWVPDVDVRTVRSLSGLKTNLYEYYDNQLQSEEYLETTAPAEVQFYFYRRSEGSNIYDDRSEYQFLENNPLYIASVDWGDGSPLEFNEEPKLITGEDVIKHNYEKPGVYEVKGLMFDGYIPNQIENDEGELIDNTDVQGVIHFVNFTTRFNLNLSEDDENLVYINYQKTSPIIGGFSRNSIYFKNIARNAGYLFPPSYDINSFLEDPIGTNFYFYNDAAEIENSLFQMDENLVGKTISPFTGSYYDQSDEVGNYDDTIPADSNSLIYRGKYSYGGELGKHPGNLDLGDVQVFKNGRLHMADLLGFVSQPLDKSFGIIEGEGAVLISAPHGCINNRPTINALHVPDDNTGALAVEIARLTGAHVIYGTYTVDDANFYHYIPDPGDSDYYTPAYQPYVGELLPYKERLRRYLDNHPEIKLVIDYHGANYKRYFAVDLGFRGDRNIPGDSVGPFGDDEYPAYSYEDALADPETYTPSLRTDYGKENLINIILEKMNEAGVGGDITDWPEAHCDPGETGWESDVTWDSAYSKDLGGWDGNQNGVPDTFDDCPETWLDFYNDGLGSYVTLANGTTMPTGGIALQRYFTAKKRPTITNYITRHNEADNIIDDENYAGHRSWIDDVAMTGEIDAVQIEWSRVYRTIEPESEYNYYNGTSRCSKSPGCNRESAAKNIKSIVEIIKKVNSDYGFNDLEDEALRGTEDEYNDRINQAVENAWTIQQQIFQGVIDYPLDETVEEGNNPMNPASDRYWKNIIPDYYDVDFRNGISTYYNLTSETHERLNGSPICGTNTADIYFGTENCVNTSPVVGLSLPQNFDLFYVWFGDPEYSWEHKTEITIRDDNTLTTTAGVNGTWEVNMSTGELSLEYSSGTTFEGTIDFNEASVPRYDSNGEVNTIATDFTGRTGYFIIPKLEFGDSLDFITQYGYKTVDRTDATIYWSLDTTEINSNLFNSIFDSSVISSIRGIENGQNVSVFYDEGAWSGDLTLLRKNSYYNIVLYSDVIEYKLLIPSIEQDGNGVVKNNFEINPNHNQEWIGENEYGNIYYYPVLPKVNIFGEFDNDLGLQQGSYNPFQFEENVELIFDETEDGDDPDDLELSQTSNIEKIPFGSVGRNWFEDDFQAPVTNKSYQHPDKIIGLNYSEIDDGVIEDNSGLGNKGNILNDYLIEYDLFTREPSTNGMKQKPILQKRDEKNTKRNY